MRVIFLLVLIIGIGHSAALAQKGSATTAAKLNSAQQAKLQKWQKFLDDPAVAQNKWPKEMCGQNFPVTLDPSLVPAFMAAGNDASLYCREVQEKLSTNCRDGDSLKNSDKAKITKLVKRINCRLNPIEDGVEFNLLKGELQASIGAKAANISSTLNAFLDATPD